MGQFLKPHSKSLVISSFFINNLQLLAFIILGDLWIAATATIFTQAYSFKRTFGRTRLKSLKLVPFKASVMNFVILQEPPVKML